MLCMHLPKGVRLIVLCGINFHTPFNCESENCKNYWLYSNSALYTTYKEHPLEGKALPSFESDSFSLLELSDEEDSATPLEDMTSEKEKQRWCQY